MSEQVTSGHCLCGGIRFELRAEPRFACHCHCENCRRAHGAGVVTWVGHQRDELVFDEGEDLLLRYLSESGATRSFCGRCGTTLFYESERWPGEVHVAAGALAEGSELAPKLHVSADRAPAWCPIVDELPRHGGEGGMEALA